MTSCLTLIPVSSVKAFARVLDSYSCVVIVSETTLISIPLKGWAAFSNHCCAVASSANAGEAIVTEAAISAAALLIVRKLFLVRGPFLLLKCRMLVPPLQRQTYSGPGCPRICSLFAHSDGAENRNGRNKRNHGSEPQARYFNSFSDRNRRDRVGADETDPQQMDSGGHDQ